MQDLHYPGRQFNLDGYHVKLFTGQLPSRLVISCVDNDTFNANYVKNPFNFKHYSLNEISLHLDVHTQPVKPLKPNFNCHQYIQVILSLFSGTGKENRDVGTDIAREDYHNGYALYAFDLSPDLAEEGHFTLAKQRTVDLKFGTALASTVTVVAYAEFENVIEIDRNRNIAYDFGMNTNAISEYLNTDLIFRKIFYGVYPANKIPKLCSLPVLIVCNTDSSSRPEEHWIELYVDGNYTGK